MKKDKKNKYKQSKVKAQYESTYPTRYRNIPRSNAPINNEISRSAKIIYEQTRHLIENYDIARGALNILVNSTVGSKGITVKPLPRLISTDEVDELYQDDLIKEFNLWCNNCDITERNNFFSIQKTLSSTYYRDGEVFINLVDTGESDYFKLELLEADRLDYNIDNESGIIQGIKINRYGKPLAYYFNPADFYGVSFTEDKIVISADRVIHYANTERVNQLRGISVFASVINRLQDIKDCETSERIAAKVCSDLTGYIKRGSPDLYHDDIPSVVNPYTPKREIQMEAGMIIDDLNAGEDIQIVSSNRPNLNVIEFIREQLRFMAGALGVSYSSLSKHYDGSFSSQRQELVEQWGQYENKSKDFVDNALKPIWRKFVDRYNLLNNIRSSNYVDVYEAKYVTPSIPWIDPLKESNAWETLISNNLASPVDIIRTRGEDPEEIVKSISYFNKLLDKYNVPKQEAVSNGQNKKDIQSEES